MDEELKPLCGLCGSTKVDVEEQHSISITCDCGATTERSLTAPLSSLLISRLADLEKALERIAGMTDLFFAECSQAEEVIFIVKSALGLQCGDCGDDGEKPSTYCQTCNGSGFKSLTKQAGG